MFFTKFIMIFFFFYSVALTPKFPFSPSLSINSLDFKVLQFIFSEYSIDNSSGLKQDILSCK